MNPQPNQPDGLYVDGRWVASADGIAVTFQGNDLTKPTSLQVSYTNTFRIPDTLLMRELTGNAEQLDSGSDFPYQKKPAYVVDDGEVVLRGVLSVVSFGADTEVSVQDTTKDLFSGLDRSIRTADLSRYDHPFTPEYISTLNETRTGVIYPLIDYGLLQNGVMPADAMFPAMFVHTVIAQMFYEEGFRLIGTLPDNEVYRRLVMPFVESEPTNHDEQWQIDRQARVTFEGPTDSVSRTLFGNKTAVNRIQPFSIDNLQPEFTQGKLRNYNTSTFTYVCDTAMRCRVQAYQQFLVKIVTGAMEVILSVEKNGQTAGLEYFDCGAGYNLLRLRRDSITLDTLVSCKKGDRLQIRLIVARKTTVGGYDADVFNSPDTCWASFTPDLTIQPGDTWNVARNLPDITGLSLLGSIVYLLSGTWSVDGLTREVQFNAFSETVSNTANALDWSNRIDGAVTPTWVPRIDPYAQSNYLRWRESEETKEFTSTLPGGRVAFPYGDGVISINASTLDTETTLFTMPFAATLPSDELLPGYGNPPLVKTRTVVNGKDGAVTIGNQSTAARLLLVNLGASYPVPATRLAADGETVERITVGLQPCWFATRPQVVHEVASAHSLVFSRLSLFQPEPDLIKAYYGGLIRVLARMRMLTVSMYLRPEDIAGLDFNRPIRLQRVQVGPLVISDGYYYINRIDRYQSGKTCLVTLIAFL